MYEKLEIFENGNILELSQYLTTKTSGNDPLSTIEALALMTIYMATAACQITENTASQTEKRRAINALGDVVNKWAISNEFGLTEIEPVIKHIAKLFPKPDNLFDVVRQESKNWTSNRRVPIIHTYVIREKGTTNIKIGKSASPKNRIKYIGTASGRVMETLRIYGIDIETELHEKFKQYRTVGEWFDDQQGAIAEYALSQK